jgi:hypothetical protein
MPEYNEAIRFYFCQQWWTGATRSMRRMVFVSGCNQQTMCSDEERDSDDNPKRWEEREFCV